MIVIINSIGLLLIGEIIWWFWLSSPKAVRAENTIVVIHVKDGVYSPARIESPAQKAITLEFIRTDSSGCSEYVVFSDLDIHEKLPLNTPYQIQLPVLQAGVYRFNCQMKMYQGELVVK